jgi:hypothetical protein
LYYRGLIGGDTLLVPPLTWDYSYGRTAIALLVVWLILVINGGLITLVFRPTLKGKLGTGSSQNAASQNMDAKMRAATWIQHLSRIDLVLAIIAVLLGASMLRGGIL